MFALKVAASTTAAVILAHAAACVASEDGGRIAEKPRTADLAAPTPEYGDRSRARTLEETSIATDAVQRVRDARDSVVPSMIIRHGSASVEVAQLDAALTALRALAQQLSGYVASSSVTTGRDQVPSATLELKIPAARYDSALVGLEPLGKVESISTTAEDVDEEFVDVSARLANARRLEERIVLILATRAGKLEDVIAAERELARIREEIERFDGRLRFLRTRVAMSTLTVTAHESYPVVGGPGTGPIAQSVKQMWRNFVLFVAWLIASLGWLLPLLAIALLAGLGVRKLWRRRATPASPAGPAGPATPATSGA